MRSLRGSLDNQHEKKIFKFSFANKSSNERSPTRAISISGSSNECKRSNTDEINEDENEEGIDFMGTPIKSGPEAELTWKNDTLETPKVQDLNVHPYA